MAVAWRIGPWIADPTSGLLTSEADDMGVGRGGHRLEKRTMDALTYLAQNRGRVVTKDELLDRVWGRTAISDNAVAIVISELRRALGDDKRSPRYIETLPKRGYRLICDAVELPVDASQAAIGPRNWLFIASAVVLLAIVGTFSVTRESSPPEAVDTSAAPVVPVILMLESANETGQSDHDQTARAFTDYLAVELTRLPGVEVMRWQESLSSPVLWTQIAKIGAEREIYVLAGRVLLADGELQLSFGIMAGANGALRYQTVYADLGATTSDEAARAASQLRTTLAADQSAQ